jgi:hypothetical protein
LGDPKVTIKAMGERIQNISDSSEKADQVIVLGIRRMLTQAINYEYQLILKRRLRKKSNSNRSESATLPVPLLLHRQEKI